MRAPSEPKSADAGIAAPHGDVDIRVPQTPAAAPSTVIDRARDGWSGWRERRLQAVTAPQGNLALVETRWLGDDVTDDETTDAVTGNPPTVTVTRLQRRNLDTGEPERGIRFWDAASAAIRNFDTITAWDFDPAWVVSARFTPVSAGRTVPFEHIRDNGGTRDLVVPQRRRRALPADGGAARRRGRGAGRHRLGAFRAARGVHPPPARRGSAPAGLTHPSPASRPRVASPTHAHPTA